MESKKPIEQGKELAVQVEAETKNVVVEAKGIKTVSSPEDKKRATDIGVTLSEMVKKIKDVFGPHIKAAHEQHKALLATQKGFTDPLEAEMNRIRPLIASYVQEERRKAEEAEKKAREEAERKLAEEQARLEAEALAAADKGDETEFQEKQAQIETARVEDHMPVTEKVDTSGYRESWKAEVVDKLALVEYVLQNWGTAHPLVEPNEKMLGQMARAMKGTFKIPGVRVWDAGTTAFGK